ncbi:MAG: imidazolonepropionase [Lysobacterales bacterium]|jgi:imidazolonepropionase-like amidohydrolase|nr:MAG: imidazolonepropionase [Xanthomonadales bacterium]
MKLRLVSALPMLAAMALASAQNHVTRPLPAPEGPVVIENVVLHPVSAPPIARGWLRFEAGRITGLGAGEAPTEDGVLRVDAEGLALYPGFLSAHTTLGLVEIGAVRATVDTAETGPINPNARAESAINPDSELIPVARSGGVLYALSVPQAGELGVLVGTSALIRLDGWSTQDMLVRAPVAMHLFWPSGELPPWLPEPIRRQAEERARERRSALGEAFAAARRYADFTEPPARDLRWEALRPVIAREIPLFIHADERADLVAALDFAEREKLRVVLVGAQDAGEILERLRALDVPVILNGTHWLPRRRGDAVSAPFELPRRLYEAGIRFAIASSGRDSTNERNLPFDAATAVAWGLPREEALKAITLYPAEILGVADRLGSLDPGKEASFILVEGDPLEIRSRIHAAWIAGRPIQLDDRHRRFYEKYLEKQRRSAHRREGA